MFDYNPMVPLKSETDEWTRLTASNHHKEVRKAIGAWAVKNSSDKRTANLMRQCTKAIVAIYEKGEKEGVCDNSEFDLVCRLTHLLMDMIRWEYGKDTAKIIGSTL